VARLRRGRGRDRLPDPVQQDAGLPEIGLTELSAQRIGPGGLRSLDAAEGGAALRRQPHELGAAVGRVVLVDGVAVFAEDYAIRRYGERGNNIVHWSEFDRGGHFAAMEVPDLLVSDMRTFFRGAR